MKKQTPIYNRLTPSQRESVQACIHGDEFDIKLEIEYLNVAIDKVKTGPAVAFPKWVYGQLLHFYTVRDFLSWVLKEKTQLTIKDVSDAIEQPQTHSARVTAIRNITARIVAMDSVKNNRSSAKATANRKIMDAHHSDRNRLPKGDKKVSNKSKRVKT